MYMFILSVKAWLRQFILKAPNMKSTVKSGDGGKNELSALLAVKAQYKQLIEGDAILNNDFDRLINHIRTNTSPSTAYYEKVMHHLIAEADEAAEDNQRMADESPMCLPENSDACKHQQERCDLKIVLDNYQARYLAG
jgi:hypothetical protein